jgi:type IV pilus assembly protein PilV
MEMPMKINMIVDSQNCYVMKNEKGYTLIEMLIAMSIFAIGMLAIAGLQISATRNNTSGNIITQATMLARTQMETLKSVGDLTTLPAGTTPDPNNPIDDFGNTGGIYTRSWTVNPYIPPSTGVASPTARQLTVTVQWTRQGANRNVVLRSITRGNGV